MPYNVIKGTNADDRGVVGSLDADFIYGYGGNDELDGFVGDDRLAGGYGDDALYGGQDNDGLFGDDGNDVLDGGAGADEMLGGAGDDTYYVDNSGDLIDELSYGYFDRDESGGLGDALIWDGGGIDTVIASISYSLSDDVENLTLTGSAAINGTGNGLNNVITGNSGANALAGEGGNDTYYVGAGDSVTEVAGIPGGIDTVIADVSFTLSAHVEHLTLAGSAAINGTGNGLNNIIRGNSATNVLAGGGGNDTYYVGAGDTVTEQQSGGVDRVFASANHTLRANIEKLDLTGNAKDGTGNSLDNVITGNALANRLTGGGGHDELVGGGGSDILIGNTGADLFRFNAPADGGPNGDLIVDFDAREDLIALENSGFGLTGPGGILGNVQGRLPLDSYDVQFDTGPAAKTAAPTVIFNATTHGLWWDADGTGAGAAKLLATLSGVNALSVNDFVIV